MTSKEFIIWLKGFITACNDYAPTPKQWDIIKEELEKVSDEQKSIGVPTYTPPLNWPVNPDPYNPYKVTCQPGTTLTTTPGSGSITIANPYIASFGGVSSTTYSYPSGSTWHYTNGDNKNYINPYKPFSTQDDDSLKPKHKKKKVKTVNDWEEEFDLGGGE